MTPQSSALSPLGGLAANNQRCLVIVAEFRRRHLAWRRIDRHFVGGILILAEWLEAMYGFSQQPIADAGGVSFVKEPVTSREQHGCGLHVDLLSPWRESE